MINILSNNCPWRSSLVQGWTGMLLLELAMLIIGFAGYAITGDFSPLAIDPGRQGLWMLSTMFCINVLVQMFVRIVDTGPFRWFIFGLTLVYTLFFIAHQLDHLLRGERLDVNMLFDMTHHVVGIVTIWCAYRWARVGK
uniref:DUF4383 domain-containing protein n=1 Tax=Candidatus Kentrum sp. LFY TaxID=2126342 RepID=A0A450WJQ4_9GAMM|nr:MAG: hypothetical protein BECKLFY1418C_GA0070996_10306 [Candidatus Kentron sp. LFY]